MCSLCWMQRQGYTDSIGKKMHSLHLNTQQIFFLPYDFLWFALMDFLLFFCPPLLQEWQRFCSTINSDVIKHFTIGLEGCHTSRSLREIYITHPIWFCSMRSANLFRKQHTRPLLVFEHVPMKLPVQQSQTVPDIVKTLLAMNLGLWSKSELSQRVLALWSVCRQLAQCTHQYFYVISI